MKEQYIQKINKMGRAGRIMAKICTVLLYVATVCCIVAGVLLALVPADSVMVTTSHEAKIEMDMTHSIMPSLVGFDEDDGIFEMNGIEYDQFEITRDMAKQTAVAKSAPYTYSLKNMMWLVAAAALLCLTMINLFRKITGIFKNLENCQTPFTQETADYFKKITMAFIPVMVMTWVVQAVTEAITTGVWDITIGIDLTMVMAVVVMMLLSEIFRYGAMLQTESDETL